MNREQAASVAEAIGNLIRSIIADQRPMHDRRAKDDTDYMQLLVDALVSQENDDAGR